MTEDKHLVQYILLAVLLVIIAVPLIYLAHNYLYQVMMAGAMSAVFIAWGVLHHIKEGRVRKAVIGEYVVIGIVIFFIAFTVLNLF